MPTLKLNLPAAMKQAVKLRAKTYGQSPQEWIRDRIFEGLMNPKNRHQHRWDNEALFPREQDSLETGKTIIKRPLGTHTS